MKKPVLTKGEEGFLETVQAVRYPPVSPVRLANYIEGCCFAMETDFGDCDAPLPTCTSPVS